VFLDAGTLNFGDLSFGAFGKLGSFRSYERTRPEQIQSRVRGATVVLTNKCPFDAALLGRLKGVKLIALSATGTNNVDLAAARKNGIAVANVSGYSTESVVQWTFAFLLSLAGNLVKHNQTGHRDWTRSPFFVHAPYPIVEVSGKTLAIVGYGAIGRRVAEIAKRFGMNVVVAAIPGRKYPSGARPKRVRLAQALAKADFVSLHAPLTSLTQNIINQKTLSQMKKGAYLINMARGPLVDDLALKKALCSGRLAGAALDVLSVEPPPKDHPLLGAPNLILTPHVAWASREARMRLVKEMVENIRAFSAGKRRNRVD